MADGLVIRRATADDRPAVLRLLASTLGWLPDEHHAAFFEWKHDRNPFGSSPSWVAIDQDTGAVAGFRTFLRWEFECDGAVIRAVRAVDTATHPDYQGRGIFRDLTLRAVDELTDEGVAFVFNTPNDQSRPGYQKMGWQIVGRLPVAAQPRSPWALLRMMRARTAADLWSSPSTAGVPADETLFCTIVGDRASASGISSRGVLATHRGTEYLTWRYAGFPPLGYRALVADDSVVIFRLRRRAVALEAVVDDVLATGSARESRVPRRVARATGADYAIALGAPRWRAGLLPLPRLGPVLTWRPLRSSSAPTSWGLTMGDVELF